MMSSSAAAVASAEAPHMAAAAKSAHVASAHTAHVPAVTAAVASHVPAVAAVTADMPGVDAAGVEAGSAAEAAGREPSGQAADASRVRHSAHSAASRVMRRQPPSRPAAATPAAKASAPHSAKPALDIRSSAMHHHLSISRSADVRRGEPARHARPAAVHSTSAQRAAVHSAASRLEIGRPDMRHRAAVLDIRHASSSSSPDRGSHPSARSADVSRTPGGASASSRASNGAPRPSRRTGMRHVG